MAIDLLPALMNDITGVDTCLYNHFNDEGG